MTRTQDKYIVRLPDGWRDAIKVRAARNRRTMNAEILSALEALVQPSQGDERQSVGEARA
ncbi:Arc family DNA-binding protein [Cereibacter sphaeroides]|nr:Arc family DNA-binding protein [Cereibacter sphaeroides]